MATNENCGGSYVKLFPHIVDIDKGIEIDEETLYSVMFGLDKCGNSVQIQLVLQLRDGLKLVWRKSHAHSKLINAYHDNRWHIFQLVLWPTGHYQVKVDLKERERGKINQDFYGKSLYKS